MDPGPVRDVLLALAGIGTGVLSAAFGVGGAVVSTPAIRVLGTSAALAVGTTLPSILPSAVTGTYRYAKGGLIDWRMVAWTAPAGVAASVGGSLLSKAIPGEGHWLMIMTAALLGFTAWRMGRTDKATAEREAEADRAAGAGAPATDAATADAGGSSAPHRASSPLLAGIGVVAGLMSGLLGVGGGIVMVPAFTELAKVPVKQSIATSLACVGVFAVPGTITHAVLDGIDWRVALLLAAGVVPGAWLGSALAMKAADRRLRLTVAGFLGLTSLLYAAGEIAALT